MANVQLLAIFVSTIITMTESSNVPGILGNHIYDIVKQVIKNCTSDITECEACARESNTEQDTSNENTELCLNCMKRDGNSIMCRFSRQILQQTVCEIINNLQASFCSPVSTTSASKITTASSTITSDTTNYTSSTANTLVTISNNTMAVTATVTSKFQNLEKNKISVGLAVGLTLLFVLAAVGAIAVSFLLWRRCHQPKSPSSEQISGKTPSVDNNDRGLNISPPHQKKTNYDQIVIDDVQYTTYTPLSLINNEPTAIVSHKKQSGEYNDSKILSPHDLKSSSTHLHDNNVSLQNIALGQIGNVNVAYFDETKKPDNGSIYFELDNIAEHEVEDVIKYNDTNMLMSTQKNASVFSNLNKEKTEAESNIKIPTYTTADKASCQQYNADPSTYFELEKHDEIDETESLSMSTADQYSKLREVSREIDSDYNQLSHLNNFFIHEHENTPAAIVPKTITISSNYSLAQIPAKTSDNLTSTVPLSTNEDISMKII